jgi:hypothetical protein
LANRLLQTCVRLIQGLNDTGSPLVRVLQRRERRGEDGEEYLARAAWNVVQYIVRAMPCVAPWLQSLVPGRRSALHLELWAPCVPARVIALLDGMPRDGKTLQHNSTLLLALLIPHTEYTGGEHGGGRRLLLDVLWVVSLAPHTCTPPRAHDAIHYSRT